MPAAVVRATERGYRELWLGEAFSAYERHEAARDRTNHSGAFRTVHDELELLSPTAADGDRHPPTALELLIQRAGHLGRGCGDGDRPERRVLRQAERAIA